LPAGSVTRGQTVAGAIRPMLTIPPTLDGI
jgi:hypothetical protein